MGTWAEMMAVHWFMGLTRKILIRNHRREDSTLQKKVRLVDYTVIMYSNQVVIIAKYSKESL